MKGVLSRDSPCRLAQNLTKVPVQDGHCACMPGRQAERFGRCRRAIGRLGQAANAADRMNTATGGLCRRPDRINGQPGTLVAWGQPFLTNGSQMAGTAQQRPAPASTILPHRMPGCSCRHAGTVEQRCLMTAATSPSDSFRFVCLRHAFASQLCCASHCGHFTMRVAMSSAAARRCASISWPALSPSCFMIAARISRWAFWLPRRPLIYSSLLFFPAFA